ncbi:DUF1617 family protein [Trueperella abortisuis]|uniref:DUF1617 family protein n=1 Tax=Trueperella abortisuis TaxID=445930 RepID=UPI002892C602|nr:DUF1617 family protein [Trueperella abortisuis]
MRITLANQQLQPVADLLASMPLKATQSRARSKLLTLVRDALGRFGEDEYALVAEYAARDDHGNPVLDAEGTFRLANPAQAAEFMAARTRLLESLAEVSGPTYDTHLADLKAMLDGYDGELSGETAEAYDVLYDAITAGGKEQQ